MMKFRIKSIDQKGPGNRSFFFGIRNAYSPNKNFLLKPIDKIGNSL